MQDINKITDKISEEARLSAENIAARAEQTAEKIVADARDSAALIIESAKKSAERKALSDAERAYSSADMKKREIMLAAKVGLVNRVFKEVKQHILSLSDEEYCIFCARLLADAAAERISSVERLRAEYGDEEDHCLDFEVLFNAYDKEKRAPVIIKAAKALLKKMSAPLGKTPLKISDEDAPVDGGIILRYGDIETNCSVDTVVAQAREKYEKLASKILFEEAAADGEEQSGA